MTTSIHDYFLMIETLNGDKDQLKLIFAELKEKIDEYAITDETLFCLYSARYYRARAAIFRSQGDTESAIQQDTLAARFQSKYEQRKPSSPVPESPSTNQQISEGNLEVCNSLTQLIEILSKQELSAEMKPMMKKLQEVTSCFLVVEPCRSLDDYQRLKILGSSVQSCSRLLHDPLADEAGERLAAIDGFNISTVNYLYRQRVILARHFVANPDALFANVPLLEANIESHTRKLAALFHTDKANDYDDQALFQKVFVDIYARKEVLLSKMQIGRQKIEVIEQFKNLGFDWWNKAVDISRARKGRWHEIQHLTADSLRNLTDADLATLQREYASQSYENYRIACHTLGNDGNNNEQIQLRKYMALALYLADPNQLRLEAQLYVIAAIHLLVEYTTDFSIEKFNELQKLIVKIQGNGGDPSVTEKTIPTVCSSTALVLHESAKQNLAVVRRDIRLAVADDKRRLLLHQCLPRSTNLRINTAEEGILEAKLQATRSQLSGVAAVVGGVAVTSGVGLKIYADVMTGFAAGSLIGPVGSIIGASLGLFSGGVLGYLLCKKGNQLCEEPLVREDLNRILADASNLYQENKIDEFFKTIAKPYSDFSKNLVKISLIEDHVEMKIDAEEIVRELLSHEFRPDGIAYFLILIGEGLLKGPTIRAEHHANRLDSRTACVEAQKLFREVYSNAALRERACFLDSKVTQIKLEDRAKYVKKMFQHFNKSVYSIPKEYFDDAITTPFATRLSELTQTARLNYAISHLTEGDKENLKRSHAALQRLKADIEKAKQQQFFQIPELRINALEDLLAAFGFFSEPVKNLAVEMRTLLSIESPMSIELIDKVSVAANSVNNCERVLGVADVTQNLAILEELLTMTSNCTQRCMSDTAPFKTLTVKNLSQMADYYHTNFRLCEIQSHPKHGRIFVPKGELIPCQKSGIAPCIYLVVDDHETNIIGMFTIAERRIDHLLEQLTTAKSNVDRINLAIEIAEIFRERAEKAEAQHHLLALPLWFDALKYYTDARNIDNNPVAALGAIRSMIMLGRYSRANNTLRELLSTTMTKNGEAWLLRAVACRKQAQFDDAHFCARESLHCDYVGAQKELKLCEKLKADNFINRIPVYERMTTRHSLVHRAYPSYNILSIDGGGCRGIIPAFWLTEIERVTKRSCSSLFDMMAGTSTGAIISVGLATPAIDIHNSPRYKAFDILQLYRNQASAVFALPSNYLSRLGSTIGKSARYTDNGRRDLFDHYFGETQLGDLLVDTVIPTVTNVNYGTRLFTYHRRSGPQPQNELVRDILMCTTAAPTYFEPYQLNSTMYIDGGVQANNPTMEAYGHALDNKVPSENIYVLSLGTGDYVPDPLHPNRSRNLLFWAANSETVVKAIFDGPQNNIDINMNRLLPEDHYHRWQVWLEKPVTLDDSSQDTLNMLCDLAREHLEAMEALDSRKRLGLLIEHLRGTD